MNCQRLDSNGRRCKRKAVYAENYLGGDFYDSLSCNPDKGTEWVVVYLCGHHRTSDDAKKIKKVK